MQVAATDDARIEQRLAQPAWQSAKAALIAMLLAVMLLLTIAFASASPGTASAAQRRDDAAAIVAAVIARLAADPETPEAYSAQVRLHVKLRIFPWIGFTLNGSSTYKRPGVYHFALRGVPKAANHFEQLSYDLGNPNAWPSRYVVALVTPPGPGTNPVIRLTPRIRGLVRTLDVTVDMEKGHIVQAVWSRHDGGIIVLHQRFSAVGDREIVNRQEASIDLPRMKAELTADYTNFSL
jgi:hypothetical protein